MKMTKDQITTRGQESILGTAVHLLRGKVERKEFNIVQLEGQSFRKICLSVDILLSNEELTR